MRNSRTNSNTALKEKVNAATAVAQGEAPAAPQAAAPAGRPAVPFPLAALPVREAKGRSEHGETLFAYDALDRLTLKDPPGGADVVSQYDNVKGDALAKNSWGRLRAMYVGSEAVNGHLYEYGNRGQTVKDEVKIDNVTYTTLYAYDAADRITTIRYPDGEVLTT